MAPDPTYAGMELSVQLPVLSVSNDPMRPASAADMAVIDHLLNGFARTISGVPWTILRVSLAAQPVSTRHPDRSGVDLDPLYP